MQSISRWTPWMELAGMHRDLDTLFNRVFGEPVTYKDANTLTFTPAADVRRDGETWKVWLAVPGIAPETIGIDIVGRSLRVSGERPVMQNTEAAEPILSEITYGRFEREFTLPEDIDVKHAQATYRNGLLELTLPLADAAKPHRIAVNASADTRQLQVA